MTEQGSKNAGSDPEQTAESIGDQLIATQTPIGRAYAILRGWLRTGYGKALIGVLVVIGVNYWVKKESNEEGRSNLYGSIYINEGRYDDAIVLLNRSIELAPNWYQPYMHRGNAFRLKGDYDHALADLDKSIELKSDYYESHYDRGLVWRDKGNATRALSDLNEAIRLKPDGSDVASAFYERSRILRQQGALDSALADLDIALTRNKRATWFIERARINFFDVNRATQAADDFAAAAREAINYRDFRAILDAVPTEAKDKPKQQPADMMAYEKTYYPDGYYALLWAHYARVHAGQDDSAEMIELVKALALPIWKKRILSLDNMGHNIDDEARALALKPWPGPIYLMFLGKSTPEAVRTAAQAGADEATRKRQQCDADFYIATFYLQHHADADARPLLQAAAEGCPADSLEAQFAKVAMKRVGG